MGELINHAKRELEIAGYMKGGSMYDGMLPDAVLEIIRVFADQGHSGMSASIVTNLVERLMRFEPLTPLQGTDDEWNAVGDNDLQNKRCSHVFKRNGEAYDIQGRVFREPNGATYTSKDSRVPVTFPYVPKTEYVDVESQS
ncbi:MAG: hypothetical protein V3W44_08730 [Dehalococcoidales bacterium]